MNPRITSLSFPLLLLIDSANKGVTIFRIINEITSTVMHFILMRFITMIPYYEITRVSVNIKPISNNR